MPVQVRAVGATAAGIANITVNYPARENNDILILFTESAPLQPVVTITPGAGGGTWTNIYPNNPVGDSSLTIWWSRWTTGQAASLTITDTGDHQIGGIMSVSGCPITGSPLTIRGSGSTSNQNTNGVFAGTGTSLYNTMVVGAISSGRDTNFTTEFSNYTNSNLINITERFDAGTNAGNGGGFGVFTADFPNIGNCGITTVDIATATQWQSTTVEIIGTDSTLPFIGWGIPI